MKQSTNAMLVGGFLLLLATPAVAKELPVSEDLALLIVRHAHKNNVPEALVYHVIKRESGFSPKLHHRVYWGLMQISGATARSMGYRGPLEGLLDADINLTYGVPYLAKAYIVAHGNERQAIVLYSRGYYSKAKR